jgi:homoserine/homoserine lactone efflux protein
MNWATIALYVPVAFVSTLLPGPSALLALSHGAAFGPLRTLYTAAGINAAVLAMMLLSYVGAGSLASWLDDHFAAYRLVCVVLLAIIGLQMMLTRPSSVPAAQPSATAVAHNGRLFATGFLVSAGNPKALLFFFLLFPGFIAAGGARLPQFTVLALIWLACEFFGLMMYAVAGQRLMRWLAQRGGLRVLNVACGALIVVMAAGLWFIAPAVASAG